MLITSSEYLISSVNPKDYPKKELKQVLLMGRSNVGKSSFINTMCNRKNLAYTSSKPGKTQTLNFYLLNNNFMFVDAPGYGYAKQAKEKRVDYGNLLEGYLNSDANIKGVFLIIDAKVGPTEDDLLVYEFLKQFPYTIKVIATKIDKVNKTLQYGALKKIKEQFNGTEVFGFSSEAKQGITDIEGILMSL